MIKRVILLIFFAIIFAAIAGCGGGGGGSDNPVTPYGPQRPAPEPEPEPINPIPPPITEPLPDPIGGVFYETSTNSDGRAIMPGFSRANSRSQAYLPVKISVIESDGDPLRHIVVRRFLINDEDYIIFIWDAAGFYNPRFVSSDVIERTISSAPPENNRFAQYTELLGPERPATTNIGVGATSIDLVVGLDKLSELEQSSISQFKSFFIEDNLLQLISDLKKYDIFGGNLVGFSGTYTRWNVAQAVSTLTDNGAVIFAVGYIDRSAQKVSTFRMGTPDDDNDESTLTNSFVSPRIPTNNSDCFTIYSSFMQVRAGTDPGAVESALETAFLSHPLYLALGDEQRYIVVNFKILGGINSQAVTTPKRRVDNMILIIPVDPHSLLLEPSDGSYEFDSGVPKIYKVIAQYDTFATYPVSPVPSSDNWFRNSLATNVEPIFPGDIISRPGQGLLPTTTFLAELDRYVSVTHVTNDYFDDAALRLTSNVIQMTPEGGSITNLKPDLSGVLADPVTGRAPLTVTFNALAASDPDGSIVSYLWEFGNPDVPGGGSSNLAVAQHTYASPGNRTALLTVVDNGIPPATVQKQFPITITSNQPPVAVADADITEGRAPLTVNFDGTRSYDPDGALTEFRWDFADGSDPAYLLSPEHTFNTEGDYIVTLRVWDDGPGQKRFAEDSILITILPASTNKPPVADFTMEPSDGGEAPLTVQFNSSTSYDPDGDNITYQWFFGDNDIIGGGTSDLANPVHVYQNPQHVIVTLQVTDDGDPPLNHSTQMEFDVIPVQNQLPVAVLKFNQDTGQPPLTVNFNGAESYDPDGSIVAYSWDFGDQSNDLGATVQHIYTEEGIYTAILVVSDNATPADIDDDTHEFIVGNTRPIAVIETDVTEGVVPLTVHFDATNSIDPDGNQLSYYWDFGDGIFSDQAVVDHEFGEVNVYPVTLTVTDDDSTPMNLFDKETVAINVTEPLPNQPPVVVIKTDQYYGNAPLTVQFNSTDESYDPEGDDIVSYMWDFAGLDQSMEPNPSYTFTSNGTYNVKCFLTDNGDPPQMGQGIRYIYVGVNVPPIAIAEADVTEGEFPLEVHFTGDTSYDPDGTIEQYIWSFNDDPLDNSNDANPVFTFEEAGDFTVLLRVLDDNPMLPGMGLDSINIKVTTPTNLAPKARIIIPVAEGDAPFEVNVNGSLSTDQDGLITAYHWDFGDPGSPDNESTDAITSHIYLNPGDYVIVLTVWDNGIPQKMDTESANVKVH